MSMNKKIVIFGGGTFIRGDCAGYFAMLLKQYLEDHPPADVEYLDHRQLKCLADILSGCIIGPAAQVLSEM